MRDLAAEILTLTEDFREPMVSYLRVDLVHALPRSLLSEAIGLLLQANLKLRSTAVWREGKLEWAECLSLPGALQSVLVSDKMSNLEFLNQPIFLGKDPVWRIQLIEEKSLYFAVHHSLCDGTAIIKLVGSLYSAICAVTAGEKNVKPLELSARELSAKPILSDRFLFPYTVVKTLLKKRFWAKFFPPVIVGDLKPKDGLVQNQLYFHFQSQEFKKLREMMMNSQHTRNLTDVVLMALHLTIEEFAQSQGGKNRIAVLVPVDRRGKQPIPEPLWNCVGTVNINSYRNDRKNWPKLLKRIQKQTANFERERTYSSSFALLRFFRDQIKSLPENSIRPDPDWRFDNSACVSHIPRLELAGDAGKWVDKIYGAPPVQTPMGISIGVGGLRDHLSVCMRYSDACIANHQAELFFKRFIERVWEIPKWSSR